MLEDIIVVIMLSIALAMDAFAMSITLGMSGLSYKFTDQAKIGLTFGLFQSVLFLLGFYALHLVGQKLLSLNSYLAALLLLYLGGKMLYDSFAVKKDHCPNDKCINCQRNKCLRTGEYKNLTWKILLVYGTATALDAFAAGVSYGLVDSRIGFSSAIIGLVTLLFSFFGAKFGGKLKTYIGNKATIIGGIILILLAIKQVL